jgi:uncharacterized membrane protein
MEFKRLKSIDIFRGLCMAWMVLNHIINWWVQSDYIWIHSIAIMIIDPIGASGFLFISGISITLSHRKRISKIPENDELNYRIVRNSYFFRAFFIFIIAIIYNIPVPLVLQDPTMIWIWFVLLTAAISLFIAWPLLKTLKYIRIIIAIGIIILHLFLVTILLPYQGESNFFGLLFHILYNGITQDPILIFFPFFLIGTVVGDIIHESINIKNRRNYKSTLLKLLVIGIILIIFGIILNYPTFLKRRSLSWIIYSIGINIGLLSILLIIENTSLMTTKKSYKLIFYYSYYSLTIYLAHNLLYFLFLNQLDIISIWFSAVGAFLSIGLVFRAIYKKWESKASLKAQVSRLSLKLSMKIEDLLKNKIKK